MAEKHDGYSSSSLATQVRESPSRPGVIWVGTDDGNVQLSLDGGDNFTNVAPNVRGLPRGYIQVARIEPSHFDPATAYVAFDNHRNDDWKPYLFKTTDYGKTWKNITKGIGEHDFARVIREDPIRKGLLYLGTERGVYVSFNAGNSWMPLQLNLPVTSSLLESLIKQFNDRVKRTEKFWDVGGAASILQVRAALLSENERLDKHY